MIVKHLTERKVLRASNMRRRIHVDTDINYIDIRTEIDGYWTDTLDTDNIDIIISRFYTSPKRAFDIRAGGINIGAVINGIFYFKIDYGLELETVRDEVYELAIYPDTYQRLRRYSRIDERDFKGNWFCWEEDYLTIGKQLPIKASTLIEIVGSKENDIREASGFMESILPEARIKRILKVDGDDVVLMQDIDNEGDYRVVYIKGIDIKNKPFESLKKIKDIYEKYSSGCSGISTRVWRFIIEQFYKWHTEIFKNYIRSSSLICSPMKRNLLKGDVSNIHSGYIYLDYIIEFYNHLKNKAGDSE